SINASCLSLADAHKEYLLGDYEKAIEKAQDLDPNDEVLYFIGLVFIKTCQYSSSRKYLQRLINQYPDSSLYPISLVKLADTYFLQKDYDSARELYQRVEENHPKFEGMPLVILRLAQIASRQGEWRKKNYYLGIIKDKYPESSEIKFVKILDSYGDYFTIQVGAFSDKANALALKNELQEEYKPYIIEDENDNFTIYKVRVGKYKNRHDVEKVSRVLQSQGYPASIYP
ncbi:MAG: tetratricopeptide repeat protein, partial [Candidatus Omnitrophica bacterium]|nr:tetratricopeptide repeat protein [Candidatus Omnitrophota bacterium]